MHRQTWALILIIALLSVLTVGFLNESLTYQNLYMDTVIDRELDLIEERISYLGNYSALQDEHIRLQLAHLKLQDDYLILLQFIANLTESFEYAQNVTGRPPSSA